MMILWCFLILYSFITGSLANYCEFEVKLEQYLINEGFHRNITYQISFDGGASSNLYENCIIGLDQTLPAGVFANPDELGDLRRMHKLSAIPKNRVNVELPAEQSQATGVFIIAQLNGGHGNTWLPVHARYHHATSNGGFARNEIEPPKLYLQCPDHRLDKCDKVASSMMFLCNGSSKEKCSWREIPTTVLTDTLVLSVPVGNTSDYHFVATITACVLIAGSLYLLQTLHEYNINIKRARKAL